MLTILLFVAAGLAQEPASASAPASDAAATGPSHVWTTESVGLKRFADADGVLVTFDAGEKLEVVVKDGDVLRVRRGTDFGWVPADKVTEEAPSAGADLPSFQLGDGPPRLQPQQ